MGNQAQAVGGEGAGAVVDLAPAAERPAGGAVQHQVREVSGRRGHCGHPHGQGRGLADLLVVALQVGLQGHQQLESLVVAADLGQRHQAGRDDVPVACAVQGPLQGWQDGGVDLGSAGPEGGEPAAAARGAQVDLVVTGEHPAGMHRVLQKQERVLVPLPPELPAAEIGGERDAAAALGAAVAATSAGAIGGGGARAYLPRCRRRRCHGARSRAAAWWGDRGFRARRRGGAGGHDVPGSGVAAAVGQGL